MLRLLPALPPVSNSSSIHYTSTCRDVCPLVLCVCTREQGKGSQIEVCNVVVCFQNIYANKEITECIFSLFTTSVWRFQERKYVASFSTRVFF